MNIEQLLNEWSKKGFRITPIRKAMAGYFVTGDGHFSVSQISDMLNKKGISPNKTTIYRELSFLESQGVINEVCLPGKKRFYESKNSHHHHLKCKGCDSVIEIDHDIERIIASAQESLSKKTSFRNIGHSLEFFGTCPSCKP